MDNKLLIVAKREYLERIRSPAFKIMTLLIPLIMTAAFLVPTYIATHGGPSKAVRNIAILDATNSGLGQRLADALMADSSLGSVTDSVRPRVEKVSPVDVAAREAVDTKVALQPRGIAGVLIITDSTVAGRTARYVGTNASSVTDMAILEGILRQTVMIARLQREGVRPDMVNDLSTNRVSLQTQRLTEKGKGASGQAGLLGGIIIGVLLFMSISIHGQNVMRGVLEEKTTRVAEVVLSSIKPETLLAGKVLGVGAVGLTQQVAWLAIGAYLINFFSPLVFKGATVHASAGGGAGLGAPSAGAALAGLTAGTIAVVFIYFLIGFVFYASLYAAVGAMVNSEQEAQQAMVPVMIPLVSTWLLLQAVVLKPGGTLSTVLSWLPWASPMIMPIRMGLVPVAWYEVAGSIAVAIAGCVAVVWLSARIYRVGMLMYGKKPSFAELARWIRYA